MAVDLVVNKAAMVAASVVDVADKPATHAEAMGKQSIPLFFQHMCSFVERMFPLGSFSAIPFFFFFFFFCKDEVLTQIIVTCPVCP